MHPKCTISAKLRKQLPFSLTAAQVRVWSEIEHDLARVQPMHRLLQGDVGSGKTVIAALAAARAIENGLQAALMAPTEILAEQHFPKSLNGCADWSANRMADRAFDARCQHAAQGSIASGSAVDCRNARVDPEAVAFTRLGLAIVEAASLRRSPAPGVARRR